MAERSIAAVLKTVELRGSGGSNPSLSALRGDAQRRDCIPSLFRSAARLGKGLSPPRCRALVPLRATRRPAGGGILAAGGCGASRFLFRAVAPRVLRTSNPSLSALRATRSDGIASRRFFVRPRSSGKVFPRRAASLHKRTGGPRRARRQKRMVMRRYSSRTQRIDQL